jgi:S1-C subfamily serine protease
MFGRTPPWWFVLVAMAALIGLLAPIHGVVRLRNYSASEVAAQVEPGLVLLNTAISYQGVVGAGTGIVLSPNGEVLTNNHVVEGATRIIATDIGTGQAYPASVVGYDRKHDIAVVQLRGASGLPTAPLGNSSHVGIGDPVLAIGNAGGRGLSRTNGTVTSLGQTIVATDQLASAEQLTGMIETNADIHAGDSGGPLLDSSGRVVGMDTAASESYHFQSHTAAKGFAIPIDTALAIANQIQSGAPSGSVHVGATAMLGVGVRSDQRGSGLGVRQVLRGSPAARAGIVPGDVITEFDGSAVTSDTTLTDLLDQHYPGDKVDVTWLGRFGQPHRATVTLVPGPVG